MARLPAVALRRSWICGQQVIGIFKAAFGRGMLTKDEFDARVGQVLASRTYAELAVLTADIPAGLTGSRPPERARGPANKKAAAAVALAPTVAFIGMCRSSISPGTVRRLRSRSP